MGTDAHSALSSDASAGDNTSGAVLGVSPGSGSVVAAGSIDNVSDAGTAVGAPAGASLGDSVSFVSVPGTAQCDSSDVIATVHAGEVAPGDLVGPDSASSLCFNNPIYGAGANDGSGSVDSSVSARPGSVRVDAIGADSGDNSGVSAPAGISGATSLHAHASTPGRKKRPAIPRAETTSARSRLSPAPITAPGAPGANHSAQHFRRPAYPAPVTQLLNAKRQQPSTVALQS